MGVSINVGTPKWMVCRENPIQMDDLGVPPFLETSISNHLINPKFSIMLPWSSSPNSFTSCASGSALGSASSSLRPRSAGSPHCSPTGTGPPHLVSSAGEGHFSWANIWKTRGIWWNMLEHTSKMLETWWKIWKNHGIDQQQGSIFSIYFWCILPANQIGNRPK